MSLLGDLFVLKLLKLVSGLLVVLFGDGKHGAPARGASDREDFLTGEHDVSL